MPGERLAKLTVQVENLLGDNFTPNQQPGPYSSYLRLCLGGQTMRFIPTGRNFRTPGVEDVYEYNVLNPPNASNVTMSEPGLDFLLAAIRQACLDHNLAYTVSPRRRVGTTPDGAPLYAFDIQAAVYDASYDLTMQVGSVRPTVRATFSQVVNLPTIRPVQVAVFVNNALIFNSPTGSIALTASNGTNGVYAYAWDDFGAPATATRANVIGPLTYTCTVTDTSGAYTVVQVAVGSDPRLDVRLERVENDVTVVPSGGLPGYT